MRIKPSIFLRWIFPDVVWKIEDGDGVYLTFDDGPTPGVTEWILATLEKYDAKATFFVLGKNVDMYPDLYEKILKAGHRVQPCSVESLPTTLCPLYDIADKERGATIQYRYVEYRVA